MRHHKIGRAFGRPSSQKRALMQSLMKSLILHERISTTEAKAKELRPLIEKIVTRAKTDTVANRRLIASRFGNDAVVVKKLFSTLGPRFSARNGGYTRIVKRAKVSADGRKTAYIAFVQ